MEATSGLGYFFVLHPIRKGYVPDLRNVNKFGHVIEAHVSTLQSVLMGRTFQPGLESQRPVEVQPVAADLSSLTMTALTQHLACAATAYGEDQLWFEVLSSSEVPSAHHHQGPVTSSGRLPSAVVSSGLTVRTFANAATV